MTVKRNIEYMIEAVAIITKKAKAEPEWEDGMDKKKKGSVGEIECPKCGGVLKYSVAGGNHHIWGTCTTEDCLKWMM